ncbi:hypothetical protein BT96DRAFT_1086863 [Gymnopus androsaceus JB14]|uniref:Uncharacterized protein n=1 Tax=Gymnopus androsaceus JB14 TaxID=1447944 RepID=A0A6A4HW73_9AGAR|nr:hypothetical protein BT96DRAFT_1086863 [Gymnopus androsaceus JB14]
MYHITGDSGCSYTINIISNRGVSKKQNGRLGDGTARALFATAGATFEQLYLAWLVSCWPVLSQKERHGAPDTDLVDKFNYNSYGAQNSGPPPLPSPPSLRSGGPPGREVVSGHPKASFALILIGGSPLPNLNP